MTSKNTTPNHSFLGEGETLQDVPVTPIKGVAEAEEKVENPAMFICQPCDPTKSSSVTAEGSSQEIKNDLKKNTNDDNNDTSAALHISYEEDEHDDPNELQIGDHVYQWRSWKGIPRFFQHHGIVMDIIKDEETDEVKLTIADFSNVEPSKGDSKKKKKNNKSTFKEQQQRRSGLFQEGILRTYTDSDKWNKVQYEATWWKRQVFRAGTCTGAKSDSIGLVLARVNFIIQFPELLPDYHVVYSNCECVAFWCKTGTWCTLQASSFLELTAAGQVKSSATIAAAAASAQVTVPAAGVWGWFGFTSNVSYLSLHPMVIPALAGYAAVTVGTPAMIYMKAKNQWKETTKKLCDAFWESAMDQPDVFAECMTHWSDKTDHGSIKYVA